MQNVEKAIAEVASVYQSLTGKPIKPGRFELAPEVDPVAHAEASYRQFKALLEQQKGQTAAVDPMKAGQTTPYAPPADVVEGEREVRVLVDLPGVEREHLSVTVAGDAITIRAERTHGARAQNTILRLDERRKGAMLRIIALPPRARRDGIESTLRDGVLSISIPTDGSGNEATEIPVDVK